VLELLYVQNIRWLAVIRFLTNLSFYSTVMVAFQTQRGLDYTGMFAMESIISAAAFMFEVPTGVWGDRMGFRRLLLVGQGLGFLSLAVYCVSYGFWPFALASVLCGVGIACLSGVESAMVYESLPCGGRERLAGPAFSLLQGAGSAGFFLGLATGSFMGAGDPAIPFYASLIPYGLAFAVTFLLVDVQAPRERPVGVAQLLHQAVTVIRAEPGAAGLSLFGSAAFALVNAIYWYNQTAFAAAGIPVAWFGPLTAVAVGLGALAAFAAPSAERHLGRPAALAVSCFIPGAAYLLMAYGGTSPIAVLAVVGVVAGGAWRSPLLEAELNRRVTDHARATTLSALSFVGTLAGMALNLVVGWLGDQGLAAAAGSMGAALLALGLSVFFLARARVRTQSL